MRFLLSVILIALLAAVAEYLHPDSWWAVAAVSFLISLFIKQRPGKAFMTGFAAIALLWLVVILMKDIPNEHILSTRMATLFHLPNYTMFICVTVLIGGLVGGLSAWAGALVRRRPA